MAEKSFLEFQTCKRETGVVDLANEENDCMIYYKIW